MSPQSTTRAESCQAKSAPLPAFDTAPRFDPNYSLRFSGVAEAAAAEVNALIGTAKAAEGDAVGNVVYNLYRSYALGTPYFSIPLKKESWRGLRKHSKRHLGYAYYRRGLDRMKAADFIDFGGAQYYGPHDARNRLTRVKVRPRLAYLFENLRPAFDVLRLPDISSVEVRDGDRPIAPPFPSIHRKHEKIVDLIQKAVYKINPSLLTEKLFKDTDGRNIPAGGKYIIIPDPTTTTGYILGGGFSKSNVLIKMLARQNDLFNFVEIADFFIYRRIFNRGSYEYGGRFYCEFQNVPKAVRAALQIDGEDTIELDFSAIHGRMLYAERGVNYVGDPYRVKGIERGTVKLVFNILLNASNRREALGAIKYNVGIESPEGIAGAVASAHDLIRKEFYTGAGLRLQRADSAIAERVMLDLLPEVVIPIHDSFIIRESRGGDLRDVMMAAYRAVVGFSPIIRREGENNA